MNKLQQVRYAAAYTALAQKLDKHMKQFDSDPNTQTRWIWELIQNAKDAPNRFGQTKIKQSLDDTYFTSRHNGDAFEIPQLHSIVAQYSTKKEKNSQATKTTGKYGTGFITTYILSKIIEVSAILKVEIQEDSDDQNQNKKSEAKNLKQQNLKGQLQKAKFTNQKNEQSLDALSNSFKKLSTEDDEIEDFQKRTNMHIKEKHQIGKQHKGQSNFYYKKFSIQMDRSYIDRDQELPKKIEKTEKKLTKIVMQAEYESSRNPDFSVRDYEQHQRTVDDLDTEFKYKITDKRKFQMIENTLTSTKQLLPYAFLFNDNLIYYECIDSRKFREKDFSFSIKKGQVANIGTNIFLFTYQIQEDYDHKKQKFLTNKIGYIVSYFSNGRAIAAVPVHIDQTGITILRVNEKLPKYFKDFPLIGCSDLKWNALINSREFYPNEKRSQLMLSCIDETNRDKVETNWIHLHNCLAAVKEIYLFLSHHCKSGLQNLLIFNSENYVADQRLEFKAYLIQLIKEICLAKIIPNRVTQQNGQKSVEPKKLVFIELASDQNEIYNKSKKSHLELSIRANEAFSFLYGNQNTISPDHYSGFYEILNYSSQYRKYLEFCEVITFVTVNKSLEKMSTIDFKQFCVKLVGDWQKKLHQIYSLLRDYNQAAYLGFQTKEKDFDFNIFLNQSDQFKRLKADKLMFNNLPAVYEQLAKTLQIDIKENLIHKQFRKYFKQNDTTVSFDIIKMENKIVQHFQWNNIGKGILKDTYYGLQELLFLFQLLLTFKCLDNQTINLIKRFSILQKAQIFTFKQNVNELHKFRNQIQNKLVNLLVKRLTSCFSFYTQENTNLKSLLSTKLNVKYLDEAVDYLKDLMQNNVIGKSLGVLPVKLAWNGIFVQENTLQKLNEKVQYPDNSDIQIYNIGYNYKKTYSSYNISDKYLQQRLVHPLYPLSALQKVKTVSHKDLYQPFQQQWFNYLTNQQQKHQILTYISQINHNYHFTTSIDNTMREKYDAWKSDIESRLQKLFNLKIQNKQLQEEPIKEFLYRLIDNKQQLNNAQLIYQNNGNALYFTALCQQLNLVPNAQKIEEPKPKAKM